MSKLSPVLKILAFLPPFLLIIGTASMMSCGGSLFSTTTATNTSSSSSTATPGGSMAFVTNFNSGTISEFKRNTTTGQLKLQGTVPAGSKQGPMGMAITPNNNSFLYAANFADGKIEEYQINSNATLTSLGFVSDGSGSGPEIIAINPAGTFLFVSNNGNGTVSGWSIGSTGTLTSTGSTVTRLSAPLGLAVDPDGTQLYVADNQTGLIYTFTINVSTGALTPNGSPVKSLNGTSAGSPGLMTLLNIGSSTFLYVGDITNGVVSAFDVTSETPEPAGIFPSSFSTNAPFGIGIAAFTSATYVITANQGAGNTWAFQVQNSGALTLPPLSNGSVNKPTGLAIDPENAFAYTADQGDGTVGIFQLNVACPNIIQAVCQQGTVATETNPPANGSAPFDVVLTN